VQFAGPMGAAAGIDECVQGMQGMSKPMDDIVIHGVLADGDVTDAASLELERTCCRAPATHSRVDDSADSQPILKQLGLVLVSTTTRHILQ
jgi:hypothetical protein